MASWKRMLEVLDSIPDIDDAGVTARGRALEIRGRIELRDLTFAYPGTDAPVLRDMALLEGSGFR